MRGKVAGGVLSREEDVNSRVMEVLWPGIYSCKLQCDMNNDCLFSYGEDVFLFLSKFCVVGLRFSSNVIGSASAPTLSLHFPVEGALYTRLASTLPAQGEGSMK